MGWNPIAFSEIEKFPSQVLAQHYPNVPNLGDMTKYKEWELSEPIDILVGGTPCQSFSVAGLRKGLDDPRGNLALTYVGILDKFRPKWCIWENVPGVLSSGGGRDFGSFLGALGEIGYGWAYRVLDAQYFGVAQRRKRVFVVGYLGDWKPPAEILFESESLSGDIKKGRSEKKDIANCLTKSPASHSSYNPARGEGNAVVVKWPADKACTLNASFGEKLGLENQHINSGAPLFVQAIPIHDQATRLNKGNGLGVGNDGDPCPTLTRGDMHMVATFVDTYNGTIQGDVSATMTADVAGATHSGPKVMQNMAVRRLTPTECERLQGFPDGYTNIKENCPDGPRYKALGNSMAVPVMRWIGERINQYEQRGMEKQL
jgi:DNA (cytosine-5)-methyltransferase 1